MGITLILNIIALTLFLIGTGNAIKVFLRRRWPSTDAKILISRISPLPLDQFMASNPRFNDEGELERAVSNKLFTFKSGYLPHLLYRYQVGQQVLFSRRMYSAPLYLLNVSLLRFYTEGASYPVHYHPDKPQQCFLRQSSYLPSLLVITLAIGVLLHQPLLALLPG